MAAHRVQSSNQFADISTLVAANQSGQGGQDQITVAPLPINDNSFMAHNPISTDYIDTTGLKRNQVTEYTVQSGDLLSFIASDYGVSMNSIIWSNNLTNSDSLQPGQILKIPPVSGIIHTVKKGENIASLAKKYGVEEVKIVEFNDLPQSGEIQVGDELIVPDGQLKTTYLATSTAVPKLGTSKINVNQRFAYLPDFGDYFMLPTSGYNWGRIHGRNGVDMANKCGTPIYAAADGSVATSDGTGYNGGFGKYIKLIHDNGTETLYAHATKLLVGAGESVAKGQQIALMGSTGRSTGCHLHFEVHGARNPMIKY